MLNPYLQYDTTALALSIAASAGQVLGIVLLAVGIASGGSGSSSSPSHVALLQGDGWSMTPMVTANGIGMTLVH
jgi:hypothetical protein